MTGKHTPEGDKHGYVGELIDPDWGQPAPPADPVLPPRLDGQPEFPHPGVYFGLDEETYHAVPACSTSRLKKFSVSSMNDWATSNLNPDYEPRQSDYFDYGKAIHCFVLEGEAEYDRRYAVDLDPADYQGQPVLTSTEEIKAAIGRFREVGQVKPEGTTKQALIDQLVALGEKHGVEVDREGTVPQLRAHIAAFMEERAVSPVSRVSDAMSDGTEFLRPATKSDWIAQLLALDPEALVWDDMLAKHRAANEGKAMISAKDDRRIRIAARMILGHEEIGAAFRGGFCEVSLFWFCPETGAPMKARLDYLKMRAIVDLKSFSNVQDMPVDRAIERTIANYRYNLQDVIYVEGVGVIKALIRERGIKVVFDCDDPVTELAEKRQDFCLKWAKVEARPDFLFVFQQSGIAPVTRGKFMPRGTVFSVTQSRAAALKRKWVECVKTYGTDPWIDMAPLEEIDDEAIPLHATELGKVEA